MSLRLDLGARLRSFRYALRGIAVMLRSQANARIHAIATLLVLGFAGALGVGRNEWLALVLAITAVWSAEALNTAFEALCDAVSPDRHPTVERAKDVAAAAVLLASLGALAVGLIVFAPRLLSLLD